MKTTAFSIVALVVLCGANQDDAPGAKELEKLKGPWATVSIHHDGNDLSDKIKLRFIFKGDQAVVEGNDEIKKSYATLKFKLDPSTKPPLMDITVADGGQKDVKFEGIYEVKGDQLKLCVKVIGNERPGDFKSEAGSNVALLVLKREP